MTEPSVLIIDDEEMVRTALDQWLRLSGFVTATAANVGEIRPGKSPRSPPPAPR